MRIIGIYIYFEKPLLGGGFRCKTHAARRTHNARAHVYTADTAVRVCMCVCVCAGASVRG